MIGAKRRNERADIGGAPAMAFCDFAREALESAFVGGLRRIEQRCGASRAFHGAIVATGCASIMACRHGAFEQGCEARDARSPTHAR